MTSFILFLGGFYFYLISPLYSNHTHKFVGFGYDKISHDLNITNTILLKSSKRTSLCMRCINWKHNSQHTILTLFEIRNALTFIIHTINTMQAIHTIQTINTIQAIHTILTKKHNTSNKQCTQ